MSTRTRFTACLSSLLVALTAFSGLFATVRPATALGNAAFTNVVVTTTSSTAKISFTSSATQKVRVTVGTGLDPMTTKVFQVELPYSASHKYVANVTGLHWSTPYSFRIGSAFKQPFIDITSLVTKPPPFRNVMVSVKNVSATIDFDYDGPGPVSVVLSKTLDFVKYYKMKSLSYPSSGSHWWVTFNDLSAGTAFAFKIHAAATYDYTDITTIITKHRDVKLTYTSFYAINDGDAWPYGCGDFALTHHELGASFYSDYWMTMATGQCVYSGHSLDLNQFTMGKRTFTDVKEPSFRSEFWAWDDDRKYLDPECFPDFVSSKCGDIAYGVTYLDISQPGTHNFQVHAHGLSNALDVIAYANIVVTYY